MIFLSAKTPKQLLASDFERVIDEYLGYFAGGSSHTARAKRLDLKDFTDFMRKHSRVKKDEPIKTRMWDHSAVQAYLEAQLNKGAAPSSVARRLATLKHLGRTLAENIVGFVNPAKEAKAPKTSLQRPKGLAEKETSIIIDGIYQSLRNKKRFSDTRNFTILILLLETGLRADECRLLRRSQIAEGSKWISNVRTKGRKFRNIYISSRLKPHLDAYLETRSLELKKFFPEIKKSQDAKLPLFISTYKADPKNLESFLMGAKTLWRAINQASNEFHLHPHLLRHSFALNLLESSKDVRLVSQALGHGDVRVTMRYTQRQDEDIAMAMEQMGHSEKIRNP